MKVHKIKLGYNNLHNIIIKKSPLWDNAYITWYNFVIFNTENYQNYNSYSIVYDPINFQLTVNNIICNKTDNHSVYDLFITFHSQYMDDSINDISDEFRNKINL